MKINYNNKLRNLFAFIFVISLITSLAMFASAQNNNPPPLTDFQQFYGAVEDLPIGNFILVIRNNGVELISTPVTNAQYGYSPTVKVSSDPDDLLEFYVIDTAGNERIAGYTLYQQGDVTEFDVNYLNATDTTQNNQNQNNDDEDDDDDDSSTGGSRDSTPQANVTCRYNWECSSWTTCSAGQQSRSCVRIDECDEETMNVTTVPRPDEIRTCQDTTTQTPVSTNICQPNSRRCSGDVLEQCSFDGQRWDLLQICSGTCDAISLSCQDAAPLTGGSSQDSDFPWLLVILTSVAALALAGVVTFLIINNNKKYKPVKDYIAKAKQRGMSSLMIKNRLVTRGWDPKKVDKLLK